MISLENLALFLRIVEKSGLAAAGRELGLSPATVSERLAALERQVGAALLVRTTRAVRPTEEGRLLADGARRLLAEADELESRVRHGVERLSGHIRLSAAEDIGARCIVPVVDAFLDEHPQVSVDLHLSDGYVDVVGQGMDFAVRYGELADSGLKARSLGGNRKVVCASPAYVAAHGAPAHPLDLAGHECLLIRFGEQVGQEWGFSVAGEDIKVMVRGRRIANDGALVRRWCLEGRGIAYKSIRDVRRDLVEGRLVELLADYARPGGSGLHIVYPGAHAQPRRVRLLIERIADYFRSEEALPAEGGAADRGP